MTMGNEDLSDKIGKLKIELERTRKALDIVIDRLKEMTWGCDSSDAEHLLKEIEKILEQKD